MTGHGDLRERLARVAIPLDSVDTGTSSADLGPLIEGLSSKAIVGLGESAHQTSEFPRLKHRLARELVYELDFEVIACEWRYPETLLLNEYVTGRTDDLTAVRAAFADDFDQWLGREWLALLDWLRRHNRDRPADQAVPIYGFTKAYGGAPADALVDFLQHADEGYLDSIHEKLAVLQHGLFDRSAWSIREDRLEVARALLPEIRNHLAEHRAALVAETSEDQAALALRQVRMLEQAWELQAALDDPDQVHRGVRDRLMAENLDWLVEHAHADRAVVSAGNGHLAVRTSAFSSLDVPLLGSYLRDRHGDDYYALAMDFGHETVRANRPAADGEGLASAVFEFPLPHEMATGNDELDSWSTFTADDLADPPLHAVLTTCEFDVAVLDFEALMADEVLAEWLAVPHLLHSVGNRHWPSSPRRSLSASVLPDQFDGLLYVGEVGPRTPLDR